MKQQEADALRSVNDPVPEGLNLKAMLGVIPTWRLFDIATCFGLWRTEGMSKHELVTALSEHVMVTPSGLWTVMNRSERAAAMKLVPTSMIEAKNPSHASPAVAQAKTYQFPRSVLEMLENTIFGGRLRKPQGENGVAVKEPSVSRSITRPLLSILFLLDLGRVGELSASFGVFETQPLEVAVGLERKNVRSKDLLRKLTTDELRLVAAAWTLTAPRDDLLTRLEGAMEAPKTVAGVVPS